MTKEEFETVRKNAEEWWELWTDGQSEEHKHQLRKEVTLMVLVDRCQELQNLYDHLRAEYAELTQNR